MYEAAILGASGYVGGELLRLLLGHPEIRVKKAYSRRYADKPVHYVHPHLRGFYRGLRFERFDSEVSPDADIVFNALPHGEGIHITARLVEQGIRIVDLSADFRLKDPEKYKVWYGFEHPYPDLLEKFVYGLPELNSEELRGARLIASPGCNATASILAAAPLIKEAIIDLQTIIIDVKVGSSEAGRTPYEGSHHPEREGTIRPYQAWGHRHLEEFLQEARKLTSRGLRASMIPHAVSSIRGALASVHSWLTRDLDELDLWKVYARFYRGRPFIRIVYSSTQKLPDTKNVVGSNYADVSFAKENYTGRVSGFTALDNLVKGAAGQAIQALNISLGLREEAGLEVPPLKPA
uniref:Putative [LysW]-L-2-aminoadipate/[LysW]-L-glutamate phosphate reductase n=1 Tax=Fervidicoccus fontis TaxID=683846 RepID=A0A7J3ZLA4_9CREN